MLFTIAALKLNYLKLLSSRKAVEKKVITDVEIFIILLSNHECERNRQSKLTILAMNLIHCQMTESDVLIQKTIIVVTWPNIPLLTSFLVLCFSFFRCNSKS